MVATPRPSLQGRVFGSAKPRPTIPSTASRSKEGRLDLDQASDRSIESSRIIFGRQCIEAHASLIAHATSTTTTRRPLLAASAARCTHLPACVCISILITNAPTRTGGTGVNTSCCGSPRSAGARPCAVGRSRVSESKSAHQIIGHPPFSQYLFQIAARHEWMGLSGGQRARSRLCACVVSIGRWMDRSMPGIDRR